MGLALALGLVGTITLLSWLVGLHADRRDRGQISEAAFGRLVAERSELEICDLCQSPIHDRAGLELCYCDA